MQIDRKHIDADLDENLANQPGKRLFIGLTLGTSLVVCLLLILLFIIPFVGLKSIHPLASWLLGAFLGAVFIVVAWSAIALAVNVATGRSVPFFNKTRGLTIRLFLPLMTLLGRTLGFTKQRIRGSFIKVNNQLVRANAKYYKPEQMLLLMPHCLQRSKCKMRLTYDINNCKRCGLCPIDDLLYLSEKYGIHLAIATGGTIARRIVVQTRPKLILAVACERDLASGIQDTYPLPVFGVMNERPFGPCLDTTVQSNHIESAIRRFIKSELLVEIDARPEPERKGKAAAKKITEKKTEAKLAANSN